MAFEWNQSLSVGVEQIDAQHRELFARVNKLLEATSQGKGRNEVGSTIDFLADYVVSHFASEERLMSQHSYPEYGAHKAQHDRFMQEFHALKDKFEAEGVTTVLIVQVQRKVCDWLVNHVSKVDKALGSFLVGTQAVRA